MLNQTTFFRKFRHFLKDVQHLHFPLCQRKAMWPYTQIVNQHRTTQTLQKLGTSKPTIWVRPNSIVHIVKKELTNKNSSVTGVMMA